MIVKGLLIFNLLLNMFVWDDLQDPWGVVQGTFKAIGATPQKFVLHFSGKSVSALSQAEGAGLIRDLAEKKDDDLIKIVGQRISIKLTCTSFIELDRLKSKITTILNKYKIKYHSDFSIQGSTYLEMNSVIVKTMKYLQAKKIESLDLEQTKSISGYSDFFKDKISAPNGYINMQVAVRQDCSSKQVFFTLGSPIITIEF